MNNIVLITSNYINYIKALSVYDILKNNFNLTLIYIEQKFDNKINKFFFEKFKFPDIHLYFDKSKKIGDFADKLYNNNIEYLKNKDKVIQDLILYQGEFGKIGEIIDKLKNKFDEIKPDLVILFGNDISIFSAGLASKILDIDIANIESGLRTGDIKMSKEVNSILIDHITKYYFVTDKNCVDNLKKSGIIKNIYLVGSIIKNSQKKYLQQTLNTKKKINKMKLKKNYKMKLEKIKDINEIINPKSIYKIYERLQIERHLKYRMGIFYNTIFENPNINKINCETSFTNTLDVINSDNYKVKKSGIRCSKSSDLIKFIKNYSKNVNFIINFSDGRRKPYGKSITNNNYNSKLIPFMVFNRHINIKSNSILFPIKGYQNFGCENFKYYNNTLWKDKINKLIYRGSPTGSMYLNNLIFFTSTIKSLNKRLKQDINNKTDNNYFEFIYNNFPRFKFTYKFHNNNLINAGLTLNILKEKIYNYEYLYKDRIEIEDMLKFKYHILIDGNDWASSLSWVLLNDCVAFMPEITYESIFTINLVPWKHYVPIRRDFEDLEEKIKYMINNDNLAKQISANSSLYMKQFTNIDLMTKIKIETITRYSDNCKI
jgi:hypothetical protein